MVDKKQNKVIDYTKYIWCNRNKLIKKTYGAFFRKLNELVYIENFSPKDVSNKKTQIQAIKGVKFI